MGPFVVEKIVYGPTFVFHADPDAMMLHPSGKPSVRARWPDFSASLNGIASRLSL